MKTQTNKSFKSNLQSSSQRDNPSKAPTSTDRQSNVYSTKNEEICHSARNWKIEGTSPTVGLESLRNRGLISPIVSPKSKYPNLPYAFANRHNQSLQKPAEKSNISLYVTENQQSMKHDSSGHLMNISQEALKHKSFHPANMMSPRDVKNSPPRNTFLEVFRKMPTMPGHQDNSHTYALSSDRNFHAEISSARDPKILGDNLPQQRKTVSNYPQIKQKSTQAEDSLNIIGSAISPNPGSPTRNIDNNSKSKIKDQCPLSHFISGHLIQRNVIGNESLDDEKNREESVSSTLPTYKKDLSYTKLSTSASNNPNSNILEASRGESQNSKDVSYLREVTATGRFIRKIEGPSGVVNVRNFQINKQRPDSSFDKNHIQSVKSMDFYQTNPPEEEQRHLTKPLKSSHLDILDTDDRFKRENERSTSEKSKKNFYQFHNKLFTENIKRTVVSQNEIGSSLGSHLVKDIKNIQQLETLRSYPLDLNTHASDRPSLEALVSPLSKNDKSSESSLHIQASRNKKIIGHLRVENSSREVFINKGLPHSTKHQDRRNELLEDHSSLKFGKRVISQNSDTESQGKTNKSMTVTLGERPLLGNDKTSRALTNEDLDGKIVYQKANHSKNMSFGADIDESVGTHQSIGTKNLDQGVSERKEIPDSSSKLKEVYERIRTDLLKCRTEKSEWLAERKQLLEKIDLLEKRVVELEKKD